MRYLLSGASQSILAALAQERTLCAFDFDGTLAPIVKHPDQARLSDCTRQLLVRLAELYPCVILSGRGRAELLGKLGGIPFAGVFGSHGAEGGGAKPEAHPLVTQWKAALELGLSSVPGLWVEDKGLSLAVHYRDSSRKPEVRRQILLIAQNLDQARIVGGKDVVNVVVDGDPHKGTALLAERDRLRCESVLYVGDDDNDEDAFAIGGRMISVRIGRSITSKASYYLRAQAEIDTLIQLMVRLREQSPEGGRVGKNSPKPICG
ncbi:MAG: trehalose-phosphatase [Acidobacteriota bacterium]